MSELANYSIETDQLVWLQFKGGESFRVPLDRLDDYLSPKDLRRVHRTIKLRRDFLRQHFPRTLVAVAAAGLAAFAIYDGSNVAGLWVHAHPATPLPAHEQGARSIISTPAAPAAATATTATMVPTATPQPTAKPAVLSSPPVHTMGAGGTVIDSLSQVSTPVDTLLGHVIH
jgi:hypothetical protein